MRCRAISVLALVMATIGFLMNAAVKRNGAPAATVAGANARRSPTTFSLPSLTTHREICSVSRLANYQHQPISHTWPASGCFFLSF